MLNLASIEHADRTVQPDAYLGELDLRRQSLYNFAPVTAEYTLAIFAPTKSNSYPPVILKCKTQEEFVNWIHIARRCGYFHEIFTKQNPASATRLAGQNGYSAE